MQYTLPNFLAAETFLIVGLGATYEMQAGEWSLYKSASSEPPNTIIEASTPAGYLRFDAQTGQGIGNSFLISLPEPLLDVHLALAPDGTAKWFLSETDARDHVQATKTLYAQTRVAFSFQS